VADCLNALFTTGYDYFTDKMPKISRFFPGLISLEKIKTLPRILSWLHIKMQGSDIGLCMLGRIIEQGSFLPGFTAGFAGCTLGRRLGRSK
jgi:hypothetical protein